MPRMALCVRYNGSAYHGWQAQHGVVTVQGTLEPAVAFVADHPVRVFCAGRTDAGVHATAQIIHFDTTAQRAEREWVFGINSKLPQDISVVWAVMVSDDFHARFKATARRYRYVLYNDRVRPAVSHQAVGWWYRPLDEKKMHQAARALIGRHDFSAYRGSGCQAHSPVREIHYLNVQRCGQSIVIDVQANAFLLHMVRNMVGVLVRIGEGDYPPQWAQQLLEGRDRCHGGMTFSPAGLYLTGVDYPACFGLPSLGGLDCLAGLEQIFQCNDTVKAGPPC